MIGEQDGEDLPDPEEPDHVYTVEPQPKSAKKQCMVDQVYAIDSQLKSSVKWWNPELRFLCPLEAHNHDLH